MEEQQNPVHVEPAIVASSSKKHSWSKKERLALYVAGVFALVGIGFGGFTFYNQVILNAAGEDSLGSDVVVDLPAANESPYFKVLWVSQQDVGILPTGDAGDCWMTKSFNTPGCDFGSLWRLEQSSNPSDESSWKTVYERQRTGETSEVACGVGSSGGTPTSSDPSLPVLATSLRRLHRSTNECAVPGGSYGLPMSYENDTLLKSNTDYYFRVSKRTAEYDGNGVAIGKWEPQTGVVAIHTKSYPQLALQQDSNQLVFSWTGASGLGSSNGHYDFTLLRSTNPADFTDKTIATWDEVTEKQPNDRGAYTIDVNSAANADLAAGQKTITQSPNTEYYYALAMWNSYYSNDGVIYKLLSEPYKVNTNTAVSTKPIVNLSIAPLSVPANKLDTITLTASLKDSCVEGFGGCDWDIENKARIKNYPDGAWDMGLNAYSYMMSDKSYPYINSSDDRRSLTMSPLSTRLGKSWQNVTDALPGSYVLESTFTIDEDAVQTIKTPITLTKVTPNLSASYKSTSVKYKSDVIITVKNAYPDNYSVLPSGKIIIKNLNNKKTLKEVSLADYQTSRKITLKGVKKGKYNLAVIFQADSKKGIFENQTINLPQLTVK